MKKISFLVLFTVLILATFTSCGAKKSFDDELVIYYKTQFHSSGEPGNSPEIPNAVKFYKEYGLTFSKGNYSRYYLKRNKKYDEFQTFMDNLLAMPEFYERNDSKTELWQNYYAAIKNPIQDFLATGKTPGSFSVHKNYFSMFFGKEPTEYKWTYEVLSDLEESRLRVWEKSEEGKKVYREIASIISKKFIACSKLEKNHNDLGNFYQDYVNRDEYKEYFPCEIHYYASELPDSREDDMQFKCYENIVDFHKNAQHENCQYIQTATNRLNQLKTINSIDWKLYYLSGEYITDEDIAGICKFRIAYIGYPTILIRDILSN